MNGKRDGPKTVARDNASEANLQRLVLAAERDPQLMEQLLQNPEGVAEKYQAQLAPEEAQQIKHVAALRKVIDDYKINRDIFRNPIFYPIDIWWRKVISYHIIRYPVFYHVFYPRGYSWQGGLGDITSRADIAERALAIKSSVLDRLKWRFYPRDVLVGVDRRINELTRAIEELKAMRGGS